MIQSLKVRLRCMIRIGSGYDLGCTWSELWSVHDSRMDMIWYIIKFNTQCFLNSWNACQIRKATPWFNRFADGIKMMKSPTVSRVTFNNFGDYCGAFDICNALSHFIAITQYSTLRRSQLDQVASKVILFFNTVSVFHKIQFFNVNPQSWLEKENIENVAHTKPSWTNPQQQVSWHGLTQFWWTVVMEVISVWQVYP